MTRVYRDYDHTIYDYDRRLLAHHQFHPRGLTPDKELLPLAAFKAEHEYHAHAQKRWSAVIHHAAWLAHWNQLVAIGGREAVRFVAASQPHAGDFLNAVPSRHWFRIPTWALRLQVQRRLGLPVADGHTQYLTSPTGKRYDRYGDVAQNDGRLGHAHRHSELLTDVVRVARSVWGARVEQEPEDHLPYSNTWRPDMVAHLLGTGGSTLLGELKFIDPLCSDEVAVPRRGAYVAMGNTRPQMELKVLGCEEHGSAADGAFVPRYGTGHVAAHSADYSHALAHGCDVLLLLFETFGGFGPGVMKLLHELADHVHNKLSHAQYDQTSWGARSWMAYQCHRLSVRLHVAAAFELAAELGMAAGRGSDPRGGAA